MKFILGRKIGMSRIFTEKGESIPVTLIEAGPCKVIRKKSEERDGYNSVQIGFDEITKGERKSAKGANFRQICEFRIDGDYSVGDTINASLFKDGDKITVSGISKGKGFQGAVKRWGFSGIGATHGTKHSKRKVGSIGTSFPERVVKGRKMPGRMGSDRVTVKGLEVVQIDAPKNIIILKGAVPGKRGAFLEIRG